ncbi:MAG TPA: hypothetical protein EYH50_03900 [Pyrodictium delaneyi]|uniref:Uncharacterized protein n=1 Tax=Pyrodictium delaneyi TaxID=1273541 RepID=A0A832ZTJ4_9CREN|nr:hypothetical protein [Pyrodictium delaneyi]
MYTGPTGGAGEPGLLRRGAGWVAETLKSFTDIIVDYELSVEEATPTEGPVRGRIVFVDGSQLEFLAVLW